MWHLSQDLTICIKDRSFNCTLSRNWNDREWQLHFEWLYKWFPSYCNQVPMWISQLPFNIMIYLPKCTYCDVPGSSCLSKKGESRVRFVSSSFFNFCLGSYLACRSGPPVDGPKDLWPRVLSLPGGFVGDPASLARDNILVLMIASKCISHWPFWASCLQMWRSHPSKNTLSWVHPLPEDGLCGSIITNASSCIHYITFIYIALLSINDYCQMHFFTGHCEPPESRCEGPIHPKIPSSGWTPSLKMVSVVQS